MEPIMMESRFIKLLSMEDQLFFITLIILCKEYDDFDVKNTTADVIFKIKGINGFEYLKSYEEDEDLKEM
jgi:hypothetical protein